MKAEKMQQALEEMQEDLASVKRDMETITGLYKQAQEEDRKEELGLIEEEIAALQEETAYLESEIMELEDALGKSGAEPTASSGGRQD